jgi:hypothetical protein
MARQRSIKRTKLRAIDPLAMRFLTVGLLGLGRCIEAFEYCEITAEPFECQGKKTKLAAFHPGRFCLHLREQLGGVSSVILVAGDTHAGVREQAARAARQI